MLLWYSFIQLCNECAKTKVIGVADLRQLSSAVGNIYWDRCWGLNSIILIKLVLLELIALVFYLRCGDQRFANVIEQGDCMPLASISADVGRGRRQFVARLWTNLNTSFVFELCSSYRRYIGDS